MKRSAGDEDGPGQKRLVRRHEGQARGSAATARMIFPPFPPLMPWIKETIWSGTLEFKNRPHSNDQRQDVDIISFKIDTMWGINTDNWPKQLKMTTITKDDSFAKNLTFLVFERISMTIHKLRCLDTQTDSCTCTFTVDGDCDKMSIGAFIQYISSPHDGCVLLEYTSSAIQVMFLEYGLLHGEKCVGFIMKYTNNDRTVKLLTDLGILPRVTAYDKTSMAKKEREMDEMMKQVIEQRRALLQKDEALKEKEVELSLKEEELVARDSALSEKEGELTQRDGALSVIEGELRERDKVLSREKSDLVVKDITLMAREDTLLKKERALRDLMKENDKLQHKNDKLEEELQILQRASSHAQHLDGAKKKTVTHPNIEEDMDGILQREATRLELVNDVETKQAAIDAFKDVMENEFKCSICAQLFIKTTTLNCSHSFCEFCIKKWLDENRTCPNCRLMTTFSVRSVVIDNCIEKIVSKLEDEAKKRRKENVREREETITVERYGQPVVIQDDDETDDQSSTVTSPSSSSTNLRSPASMMSSYHPSPASTLSSTWWRSPSSIANMFSPRSVSSTNTASPAAT